MPKVCWGISTTHLFGQQLKRNAPSARIVNLTSQRLEVVNFLTRSGLEHTSHPE